MNRSVRLRLARIEAALTPPQPRKLVVISNNGDGGFYAVHRRFKTDAEMDAEEAAMRASGAVQPGDEVDRIILSIVAPKPQLAPTIRIPTPRQQVDHSAQDLAARLLAARDEPSAPPPRAAKPIPTYGMTMDEFAPLGSGRGTIRVM